MHIYGETELAVKFFEYGQLHVTQPQRLVFDGLVTRSLVIRL